MIFVWISFGCIFLWNVLVSRTVIILLKDRNAMLETSEAAIRCIGRLATNQEVLAGHLAKTLCINSKLEKVEIEKEEK